MVNQVLNNSESIVSFVDSLRYFQHNRVVTILLLPGGITNTNYVITDMRGSKYVVKVAGESSKLLGIHRHTEKRSARAAYGLHVAPKTIYFNPTRGISITEFIDGNTLEPSDVKKLYLSDIVTAVLKFHTSSVHLIPFSPLKAIHNYLMVLKNTPPSFSDETLSLFYRIMNYTETYYRSPCSRSPCHNDLLGGNFIVTPDRLYIIDWEYSGMGDPLFDLGNIASNNSFEMEDIVLMAKLYFGTAPEEVCMNILRMKAVSHIRETTWAYVQLRHSTLPFDFQAYADVQFDTLSQIQHDFPHLWRT